MCEGGGADTKKPGNYRALSILHTLHFIYAFFESIATVQLLQPARERLLHN